jgi:glycosyltransferase involved in cell wall biosynthesis
MPSVVKQPDARPTASVLLPVYNAERYLSQAGESVLAQTFRDFELLFLNDGSTDGSLKIMEAFAERDQRCRIHSWPNRGLVSSLNAGLELASGEFIIRMDSDDICRPERFERQISFLQANPDHVAVGSRLQFIDPEGLPLFEPTVLCAHNEIERGLLLDGFAVPHSGSTLRRSACMAIGGYRDSYPHAEDLDLFLRLSEIGNLANLPEVLLDYRHHLTSVCYQNKKLQSESARRAIMDAYGRRGLPFQSPAEELTRGDTSPKALTEVHRTWGWWALKAGNREAARKHAYSALRHRPVSLENWKLFRCVLRGY